MTPITRRAFLGAGGALVVGFGLGGRAPRAPRRRRPPRAAAAWPADRYLGKTVAPDQVDAFLAIHADDTVTVFTGRVDLGHRGPGGDAPDGRRGARRGHRADHRADRGRHGAVPGPGRDRRQHRHFPRRPGAPPRRGDRPPGAARPRGPAARPARGGPGGRRRRGPPEGRRRRRLLRRADRRPAARSQDRRRRRRSSPRRPTATSASPSARPDVPAKVTGRHLYVHDLSLPGNAPRTRDPAPGAGAPPSAVDEASIAAIPGARAVRIGSFVGVVAEREWDAVRAARALRAQWSAGTGLPDYATLADAVRATRMVRDQDVAKQGDLSPLGATGRRRADARRDVLVADPDPRLPRPVVRRGRRPAGQRHDLDVVPGDSSFPGGVRPDPRAPAGEGAADLPGRRRLLRPGRRGGRGL